VKHKKAKTHTSSEAPKSGEKLTPQVKYKGEEKGKRKGRMEKNRPLSERLTPFTITITLFYYQSNKW
jgi:hypothetical protein